MGQMQSKKQRQTQEANDNTKQSIFSIRLMGDCKEAGKEIARMPGIDEGAVVKQY